MNARGVTLSRWSIALLACCAIVSLSTLPGGAVTDYLTLASGALLLFLASAWYWTLGARVAPEALPKLRVGGLAVIVLLLALLYSLLVQALSLPEMLAMPLCGLLLAVAAAAVAVATNAAVDLSVLQTRRFTRPLVGLFLVVVVATAAATVVGARLPSQTDTAAILLEWVSRPWLLLVVVAALGLSAPLEWVVALDRRQRVGVLLGGISSLVPLIVGVYTEHLLTIPHHTLLFATIHIGSLLCLAYVLVMLARAALALPGAKAYERKVQELDAIYDFGLTTSAAFDTSELQVAALRSLVRVAIPDVALVVEPRAADGGCSCALVRIDEQGQHLYRYGSRSSWGALAERFADRRPVVIVDHRKAASDVLRRIWEPAQGSSVIVPVLSRAGFPRAILIAGRFGHYAFNAGEVRSISGFANQVGLAIEHAALLRDVVESERRKRELEIARELQLNLLPKQPPDVPGLDIADRSEPATEVGGDYFDYLPMEDGSVGLVFGDVAGHGMPAGLLMAMAKSSIHTQVQNGGSPRLLLTHLDKILQEMSADNQFMTLVFAQLDVRGGALRYANAGHHYPLHLRSRTNEFEELVSTGLPLGLLPRPPGPFREHELETGDVLVFYSDGMVEAVNLAGEDFGLDRLKRIVRNSRYRPASVIVSEAFGAVRRFSGDAPLHDDATIVVVRVLDSETTEGGSNGGTEVAGPTLGRKQAPEKAGEGAVGEPDKD